jgi:transposase
LEKLEYVYDLLQAARESGGRLVVVFLDELTYYRHPSPAEAYEARGAAQPLAHRGHGANTATRVIAAVDALTGRVTALQGSKTDLPRIVAFYRALREAHPGAERVYAAQDNWPVHFHPDVLCALEGQERRFPFRPAKHWSTEPTAKAVKKWSGWRLPVQIVPLPTYAPWTNPIEKLWRWGKQDVLHLHSFSEKLNELRERFAGFLTGFAEGSKELLRYIGLSDPTLLYHSAWQYLARGPC